MMTSKIDPLQAAASWAHSLITCGGDCPNALVSAGDVLDRAFLANCDGPIQFLEAAVFVAIAALETNRPRLAEAVLGLALEESQEVDEAELPCQVVAPMLGVGA